MKQTKSVAIRTYNRPFSESISNCGRHHNMNTSELCVWECQGTIRDTLGTSASTKTGPKPTNLDSVGFIFLDKKWICNRKMSSLFNSVPVVRILYKEAPLRMPVKMLTSQQHFQLWTNTSPRWEGFSQNPWNPDETLVQKLQIREDFG